MSGPLDDPIDDDEYPATVEEWAVIELQHLWTELFEAINSGINTNWSIKCENIAHRIASATRLVGPADWYSTIGIPELLNGRYKWAIDKVGAEATYPSAEEMDELWRKYGDKYGPKARG